MPNSSSFILVSYLFIFFFYKISLWKWDGSLWCGCVDLTWWIRHICEWRLRICKGFLACILSNVMVEGNKTPVVCMCKMLHVCDFCFVCFINAAVLSFFFFFFCSLAICGSCLVLKSSVSVSVYCKIVNDSAFFIIINRLNTAEQRLVTCTLYSVFMLGWWRSVMLP